MFQVEPRLCAEHSYGSNIVHSEQQDCQVCAMGTSKLRHALCSSGNDAPDTQYVSHANDPGTDRFLICLWPQEGCRVMVK